MTMQEPTSSTTGILGFLGVFTRNVKGVFITATAAIAIIVGFIDAVAGLANHTEPFVCTVVGSLPWCPAPTEKWSDEVGGQGGARFSALTCRDDELLVGVFGKASREPFVYSIGPICAVAKFNWRHKLTSVSDTVRNGEEIGSGQGDAFSLKCPSGMFTIGYLFDSAVVGTNFGPHEYLVSPLRLRCSSVSATDNPSPNVVAMTGQAQSNASRKPFQCPNGSAAFGIKGRAGQFVDAISLGCRSVR